MKWIKGIIGISGIMFLAFASIGAMNYQSKMHLEEENNVIQEVTAANNWGLSFQEEGKAPNTGYDSKKLKELNGYYLGDENKKEIFLTFDAGYENGNTEKILDALKKHNVSATFFLVGNYMETCPDIVVRMEKEGHTVGNHTYHHRDMAKLTSKEDFMEELNSLEILYKEITGKEMSKLYRPPQGKFTEEQLQWAKEDGYKTCFWSLAYVDWDEKKQPSKEEAMEKLLSRIHPGAIVLLHSTSTTNALIMDELLGEWKNMGYEFGSLENL